MKQVLHHLYPWHLFTHSQMYQLAWHLNFNNDKEDSCLELQDGILCFIVFVNHEAHVTAADNCTLIHCQSVPAICSQRVLDLLYLKK